MSNSLVESGHSFATANSNRWVKHTVGLDIDYVEAHLDDEALERFNRLGLLQKVLVVRAVTELSVCRFRQTRKDPDYDINEYEAWAQVIHTLIGVVGTERLGM